MVKKIEVSGDAKVALQTGQLARQRGADYSRIVRADGTSKITRANGTTQLARPFYS